jgi:hypothetical protein
MGLFETGDEREAAARRARIAAAEATLTKEIGAAATKAIEAKGVDWILTTRDFLNDPTHLANYTAKFPAKPAYPDNPINKIIAQAGMAGKTCGSMYGLHESKLAQCAQLVKLAAKVNNDVSLTNSVYSDFSRILGLPDRIRTQDPNNADIAYELGQKQQQAFYKDVQNVYGVKEGPDGKLTTTSDGMAGRIGAFHTGLAQRNSAIRDRVLSQAQTLKDLRRSQQLNQDMGMSLQDNMYKIEKDLSTKTRLIQINEQAARQKNRAVVTIAGTSTSVVIAMLAVIFYMAGMITLRTMVTMLVLSVAIVVIFLFVVREQPLKEFTKLSKEIHTGLIKEGDKLNLAALQWVDKNCDCPDDPDKSNQEVGRQQKEANESYQKLINHLEGDDEDGIWYDDGSGPPQHISLFAFKKGTGKHLASVSEGDNPEINLKQYPQIQQAQSAFNKQNAVIQKIAADPNFTN